jgi:tetratricopeptide (TPR) repeat protein
MLKDLDRQRGPATGVQLAALQGLGLVSVNRIQWHRATSLALWVLAVTISVFVAQQSMNRWSSQPVALENGQPAAKRTGSEQALSDKASPAVKQEAVPAESVAVERASLAEAPNQQIAEPKTLAAETRGRAIEPPVAPETRPKAAQQKATTRNSSEPVKALTPRQKSDRLFSSSQRALAEGHQHQAMSLLEQTLAEYPGHLNARAQLAALLLDMQRAAEAEQLLAEGLATGPYQLALAKPYAQLLAARNGLDAALETLDTAIRHNQKSDPEALALRAAIFYRLGRHRESVNDYELALQTQPHESVWWTGLAVALEHDRQYQRALAAYERAARMPLEDAVLAYVRQRIQALRSSNPANGG